jgi:hypothetical protein
MGASRSVVGVLTMTNIAVAGCATPVHAPTERFLVRHIGETVVIERAPVATAGSLTAAFVGIAIASKSQTKPTPLTPGADYACKYRHITTRDLSKLCGD